MFNHAIYAPSQPWSRTSRRPGGASRPRRCGPLLGGIFAGVVVLGPLSMGQALGQQPEELLRQAITKFAIAEFEGSLRLLERAEEQARIPRLLGHIQLYTGANHVAMNKPRRARAAFMRGLKYDPDLIMDPERFNAATLALFQEVRAGMVAELQIRGNTPGAVVFIDGKERSTLPFSGALPLGPHLVQVRDAEGQVLLTEQINLRSAVVLSVVEQPGHKPGASPEQVKPADEPGETPALALEQPATAQQGARLWTYIAAGSALAALGVGIGMGVAASQDHEEYQDCQTGAQRVAALESSIESKALAANILFGVAGALGATAVLLYFLEGRPASRTARGYGAAAAMKRAITPMIGGAYGLSLSTSF